MAKKITGMGSKLSQLSGIRAPSEPLEPGKTQPKVTPQSIPAPQEKDKLVAVNLKIRKSQKEWLAAKASQVRDNNLEPVPPGDRTYPQHLIGVAIDLLADADVDWSRVRNIAELREELNLLDL